MDSSSPSRSSIPVVIKLRYKTTAPYLKPHPAGVAFVVGSESLGLGKDYIVLSVLSMITSNEPYLIEIANEHI